MHWVFAWSRYPYVFFDNCERYFSTILFLETKPKLKYVTEICKQISFGILHISERLIPLVNDFKNKKGILYYFTAFISPWSISDQKKIF